MKLLMTCTPKDMTFSSMTKTALTIRTNVTVATGDIGDGPAYWEITDAVINRGVTRVGLIGYSHGAASLYYLAGRMQYGPHAAQLGPSLTFTSYIDAQNRGNVTPFPSALVHRPST